MPSGRDWMGLVKNTFRSVTRKDISGLYAREWRDARAKLTAEHEGEIAAARGRIRRFFRTTNAVLFGLITRLAPPRRVMFAAVLLCLFFALQGPHFERTAHKVGRVTRSVQSWVYFDNFYLFVAIVLTVLLLAMELVDKINYRDELELARDLQSSLIPKTLPAAKGWELAAYNRIANTVGGDIYDFVPLAGDRLAVLFGDASGHGMAAGLVMAVAHAAFRTQLEVDAKPEAMFATLNRILVRTGGPRAFFSCVYLLFESDGRFSGSVAGHPPLLHLSPSGELVARIGRGAYPLGIRDPLTWAVESAALGAGERLLLYSDGVSESRGARGEELGDVRIEALARRDAARPPAGLVAAIVAAEAAWRDQEPAEDDVSIAVIARTG
jgi:serine phosphatase RsbU (regulator of sigma subunit)